MSATRSSEVSGWAERRWNSCIAGCVSVRKSSTQQERGDSRKLLCQSCRSLLMQSASAESTAGLSASFTALHAWGQSAKRNTAESVETVSLSRFFFFFFCSYFADSRSRSVVWDRISDRKLSASACYLSARRHRGTGEGETTCCEYRWEQLLTPSAHQSAARLDTAKRTSLRRIPLTIGLSVQARESSTKP